MIRVILNTTKKIKGSILTVQSKVTKKDYTFKFRKSVFRDKTYLHIYVEKGYLDFNYVGFYWNGQILRKGGIVVDTPSSNAISWILRNVENGHSDKVEQSVNIMHTGKCVRCNRTLTDATSIQLGVGPICRNS